MTRPRLRLVACTLAVLLVGAAGCGTGPSEAPDRMAVVTADTAADAAPDTATMVEEEGGAESFAPAAPPPDSVWVGDPPTRVPGPYRTIPDGWTTGIVRTERPEAGVATLTAFRTARHDGFDRAVFTFDGPVPAVHVEYVDRPVRACGSGDAVPLAGDGWLSVSVRPARAHTEAGAATLTARRARPALPTLREYAVTCDFEAEVAVVLGVAAPMPYRLLVLRDPHRLVVDVRHGA